MTKTAKSMTIVRKRRIAANAPISQQLKELIAKAANEQFEGLNLSPEAVFLEHPAAEEHGDYSTNVALTIHKQIPDAKNPRQVAESIVAGLCKSISGSQFTLRDASGQAVHGSQIVEKIEVAGPGFINFWLSRQWQVEQVGRVLAGKEGYGGNEGYRGKKIMVEFAHPNTHKELHIGHMRTLITGEALVRILENSGALVFRANYQGDIGPHVAKAIWGTGKILEEQGKSWEEAEKLSLKEKAHLLGQGYIRGNQQYEDFKEVIDEINTKLYQKDPSVWPVYQRTRKWSLDYYDDFYKRFNTHFDRLYFESETAEPGKEIVLQNVGKVFEESDGAIIFNGEKYGLHKRVFVTRNKTPTYEAKDMALAPMQFADFPFDVCIHVLASEQLGYSGVIFKALELIDPKFVGRQYHLAMGMVQLVGKKISSRTGVLVTVDGLIDDVKGLLRQKLHAGQFSEEEQEKILEAATIGAIKYSVLKASPLLDATFDLEKSVSLDGDSGPYLQYTYARARSVLRKALEQGMTSSPAQVPGFHQGTKDVFSEPASSPAQAPEFSQGQKIINATITTRSDINCLVNLPDLSQEEVAILRWLYRFPEVVEQAAKSYSPNLIASYLFELAKRFNNFYNEVPILGPSLRSVSASQKPGLNNVPILGPLRSSASPAGLNIPILGSQFTAHSSQEASASTVNREPGSTVNFRLALTEATSIVIKNGLNLLGIQALERM